MRRADIRSVLGFLTLALIGVACSGGSLDAAGRRRAGCPAERLRQRGLRRAAAVQRRLHGDVRLLQLLARRNATAISSAPIRGATRPRPSPTAAATRPRRRQRLQSPVRSGPVRGRLPGLRLRRRRVHAADLRRLPGQRQPLRDAGGVPGDVRGPRRARARPIGSRGRSASAAVSPAAARRRRRSARSYAARTGAAGQCEPSLPFCLQGVCQVGGCI